MEKIEKIVADTNTKAGNNSSVKKKKEDDVEMNDEQAKEYSTSKSLDSDKKETGRITRIYTVFKMEPKAKKKQKAISPSKKSSESEIPGVISNSKE